MTEMHRYRSHTCAALRTGDVGNNVRLSGWVHRVRDHGGLLFIDLRDHYGLTQLVVDPDSSAFGLAETVRSEGYGPPKARPELADRRAAAGQSPTPRVAIVTRSAELDPTSSLFTDAAEPPLIFTPANLPADRRAALETVAEIVHVGETSCEPAEVIAELGRRGLNRVACEGGPSVLGQFMAGRLVDEICLTITPLAYGGTGGADPVSRIIAGPGLADAPRPMRLAHVMESDGTLFLRYTAP